LNYCGTGEAQAAAVHGALEDCNLTDHVNFMAFNTTSSNTNSKTGACVLLEQKMTVVAALPCRHHIHELIIAKVFETLIKWHTNKTVCKIC